MSSAPSEDRILPARDRPPGPGTGTRRRAGHAPRGREVRDPGTRRRRADRREIVGPGRGRHRLPAPRSRDAPAAGTGSRRGLRGAGPRSFLGLPAIPARSGARPADLGPARVRDRVDHPPDRRSGRPPDRPPSGRGAGVAPACRGGTGVPGRLRGDRGRALGTDRRSRDRGRAPDGGRAQPPRAGGGDVVDVRSARAGRVRATGNRVSRHTGRGARSAARRRPEVPGAHRSRDDPRGPRLVRGEPGGRVSDGSRPRRSASGQARGMASAERPVRPGNDRDRRRRRRAGTRQGPGRAARRDPAGELSDREVQAAPGPGRTFRRPATGPADRAHRRPRDRRHPGRSPAGRRRPGLRHDPGRRRRSSDLEGRPRGGIAPLGRGVGPPLPPGPQPGPTDRRPARPAGMAVRDRETTPATSIGSRGP